jgi:hypothetical protein
MNQYIIKLNDQGFYGKVPWGPSPLSDAKVFDTMKAARKQLNRIRDRLGFPKAIIMPYN